MNLIEAAVPARLGRNFRVLLSSVVISNLGDGIALAAGPLLVASETRDPLLVASAVFLQQLPWLLFGVIAGAYVDRLDRRLLVAVVDTLRAVVLVILAVTVLSGSVTVWMVLTALFLLGTAETISDLAGNALLPALVDTADLGIANARIQGGFLLTNQLVGPPIGAFLFAAARPWPFAATAACFLLGAVLVTRMTLEHQPPPKDDDGGVWSEVRDGAVWLWHHPPIRTLAITIVLFNVTFGAAWGVLVLYASDRLGMSAAGFGWLTTAMAVGGIAGTAGYGWLERRYSLAALMRGGLVIETFTHLALALTREPAVALAVMVVFGAHAFVWGTTSRTIRQRAVPLHLQGRVGSVYMIAVVGGMLIGTPLGGLLARDWGLTAPFWFGFVGSGLLVAVLWRQLGHIAHVGAVEETAPDVPPGVGPAA